MCYLGNTRNHEILRNYHTKLSQHYTVNTGGSRIGDQSPVLLVLIHSCIIFFTGSRWWNGWRAFRRSSERCASCHPRRISTLKCRSKGLHFYLHGIPTPLYLCLPWDPLAYCLELNQCCMQVNTPKDNQPHLPCKFALVSCWDVFCSGEKEHSLNS